MDHREAERLAEDIIYRWKSEFPAGGLGAVLYNLLFNRYWYLIDLLKHSIIWVLVAQVKER